MKCLILPLVIMEGGTGSNSGEREHPVTLPERYESGTANAPAIGGLGEGIAFIQKQGINSIREKEMTLRNGLWEGLDGIANVKLFGTPKPERSVGVVSFTTSIHLILG